MSEDYCEKNPDGIDAEYSEAPHCVHTVMDTNGRSWIDVCCWCGDVFESLRPTQHGSFLTMKRSRAARSTKVKPTNNEEK